MKKLMIALCAMLVAGSMVFAANPADKTVKVSTTIQQVATLDVVDGSGHSFSAQDLKASGYGDKFYVVSHSNCKSGFTLKYAMSKLNGTGNNAQSIPVTVRTTVDTNDAVETEFTSTNPVSVELLSTTDSQGVETHKVGVEVKGTEEGWAALYRADTYSADMVFSFVAK